MAKVKIILALFLLVNCFGCVKQFDTRIFTKNAKSQSIDAAWPKPDWNALRIKTEELSVGILVGKTICIDPGHCVTSEKQREQISPKSTETKNVFGGGTTGEHQTEEQLNLRVGLLLKDALESEGATVLMTREISQIAINNIERARIGNQADCCIRIHADGVDDPSVHGVSVLIPSGDLLGNPEIAEPSRLLGDIMLSHILEQTSAKNRGVVSRSDLVGFNWSEVPVVLVEMGFMTNAQEDARLETAEYQQLIVNGMLSAIIEWFSDQEGH